jgi:hypothetical protein
MGVRDKLDGRQPGGILGGLLPSPVASVVDDLPLVGSILSGGTNSPSLSAPVQSPSPTGSSGSSSNGGGSSPLAGGGSSPLNGGGSSPSTSGGSSPSNGGGSPPSSGGAPSTGSGSPPSTGGASTGGGSSPPSGGSFPSTGGSSSPFNGGGSPSPGSSGSSSGSGGGDHSSFSSTTTGTPASPGISQPSPSTVSGGSIVTGDRTLSSTNSTSGSKQNSTSTAPPVANVAGNSLPNTIQTGVVISGSPPSFTNYPNGPNGTGTNNNPNSSALANTHHQLSSGGIVAIIIAVLLLFVALPITIFVLRRRSKKQRDERKTKWFAITRLSQPYQDLDNEQLIPPGTQTARSSFVTTLDRSDSGGPALIVPPALAETGRGNASRPLLVINISDKNHNSNLEGNRDSIGSAGSDRSQYLIVPQRDSTNPDPLANTPMSVRPFSPSESFAFPKPPEPVAAGSGPTYVASGLSRPTSNATSVTSAAIDVLSGRLSLPTFTPLVMPHIIKSPSPITVPTIDPFTDNNPFEDPTTPVIDNSTQLDVKVVRCSFVPALPDELKVRLDDHVRVLHTFDDGWGLVEKVASDGSENESGLIPMDCLRKSEEDIGPVHGHGHGDGVSGCEEPHAP